MLIPTPIKSNVDILYVSGPYLENNMVSKDVLDAVDNVFRLGFCELDGLGSRLEQRSKRGKLVNFRQLLSVNCLLIQGGSGGDGSAGSSAV